MYITICFLIHHVLKKKEGSRTTCCGARDHTETLKDRVHCSKLNQGEANMHKAQFSSEKKCITVRGCLTIPFVDKVIEIKIIRPSKWSRFTRKGTVM